MKNTQSPTIQEVLGSDVDLRNEWERTESHRITREQERALVQMSWRHLDMQVKGDERRKEVQKAREAKRV